MNSAGRAIDEVLNFTVGPSYGGFGRAEILEVELDNIMAEVVTTPGGAIVEEVAAKGHLSGKSHEQRRAM
jgi:hypothetical protein